MDMNMFNKLINELDWSKDKSIQQHAINELVNTDEEKINLLINPNMKSTWENAVLVIKKIGYPKNKTAVPKLLWLLQDYNWPGAQLSIEVLKEINKEFLAPFVSNVIMQAYDKKDYMWLGGINILVENLEWYESDIIELKIMKMLEYRDW